MKIIDVTLTYEDGRRGVAFENAKSNGKVKLIALPLKIKGGDGAPARVLAVEA